MYLTWQHRIQWQWPQLERIWTHPTLENQYDSIVSGLQSHTYRNLQLFQYGNALPKRMLKSKNSLAPRPFHTKKKSCVWTTFLKAFLVRLLPWLSNWNHFPVKVDIQRIQLKIKTWKHILTKNIWGNMKASKIEY